MPPPDCLQEFELAATSRSNIDDDGLGLMHQQQLQCLGGATSDECGDPSPFENNAQQLDQLVVTGHKENCGPSPIELWHECGCGPRHGASIRTAGHCLGRGRLSR